MLWESILRNAVGLALFAAVTVGVIAATQVGTAEAIAEQRAAARLRALLEILPEDTFDNAILEDVVLLDDAALGLKEPAEAFVARRGDAVVAAMVPVRVPDGYSGEIRLVLACARTAPSSRAHARAPGDAGPRRQIDCASRTGSSPSRTAPSAIRRR
jgi:Predicted NADH:ubiquinone oxidoreductase, subunit RnfG